MNKRKLLSLKDFAADEKKFQIEEGLWLTAFEEATPIIK